jgi:5-methylcytosine-specific restriction protein A
MALRTSRPRLAPHDTRTARPRPKQADAELLTPEHRAWRLDVCRRAGWRCEWIEGGVRCEASTQRGDRLVADHIVERADGGALYDPSNGQCLCVSHNTLKGARARGARAGSHPG